MALYAAAPVYFPPEFATHDEGARTIVMVGLIPITRAEAAFVRTNGWSRFEDKIAAAKTDLIDPKRQALFG